MGFKNRQSFASRKRSRSRVVVVVVVQDTARRRAPSRRRECLHASRAVRSHLCFRRKNRGVLGKSNPLGRVFKLFTLLIAASMCDIDSLRRMTTLTSDRLIDECFAFVRASAFVRSRGAAMRVAHCERGRAHR